MITTLQEFEDASAFERCTLAALFPLLGPGASIDLRTVGSAGLGLAASDDVKAAAREEVINGLRPLLFGAAWKTLDLLLELAFHQAGHAPKQSGKWRIEEKSNLAGKSRGRCMPLSGDNDVWNRLCATYKATTEARHSLVHRKFVLSRSGAMTQMTDRKGAAVTDVSADEQAALCRLGQRAASACLTSQFGRRERCDLSWWLDQLVSHHRLPKLGGTSPQPVDRVLINALRTERGWAVNLRDAYDKAQQTFSGREFFDVEIHFPESGFPPLIGRLEDAPNEAALAIDPSSPPSWMMP